MHKHVADIEECIDADPTNWRLRWKVVLWYGFHGEELLMHYYGWTATLRKCPRMRLDDASPTGQHWSWWDVDSEDLSWPILEHNRLPAGMSYQDLAGYWEQNNAGAIWYPQETRRECEHALARYLRHLGEI